MIIKQIETSNIDEARKFYSEVGYTPIISEEETILAAFSDNHIVGSVRLCDEEGVLVLRGMQVDKKWQRNGIGTRLLEALDKIIGANRCYCLPHDYLESLYNKIGFKKIDSKETPKHLQERLKKYEHIYPNLIAMMR